VGDGRGTARRTGGGHRRLVDPDHIIHAATDEIADCESSNLLSECASARPPSNGHKAWGAALELD
jgi:hypothetical protein